MSHAPNPGTRYNDPPDACLSAEQLVLTDNGLREAGDIQVGDWLVWREDREPSRVLHKTEHRYPLPMLGVRVSVEGGESGIITVSPDHPFISVNGLIRARNLVVADGDTENRFGLHTVRRGVLARIEQIEPAKPREAVALHTASNRNVAGESGVLLAAYSTLPRVVEGLTAPYRGAVALFGAEVERTLQNPTLQ